MRSVCCDEFCLRNKRPTSNDSIYNFFGSRQQSTGNLAARDSQFGKCFSAPARLPFRLRPQRRWIEHHASVVAIPALDDQIFIELCDKTHVSGRLMPDILCHMNLFGLAGGSVSILNSNGLGASSASDTADAFQWKTRIIQSERRRLTDRPRLRDLQVHSKGQERAKKIRDHDPSRVFTSHLSLIHDLQPTFLSDMFAISAMLLQHAVGGL